MSLGNVGSLLADYTALYLTRHNLLLQEYHTHEITQSAVCQSIVHKISKSVSQSVKDS
jgi:hypothetical protein